MPQQNRVPGAPDCMFEDQRIGEPEAAQLCLDGVVMRAREEALGRLLVLPADAREIDRDGLREDDFVPAVALRGNEGERAALDLGEHAVDEVSATRWRRRPCSGRKRSRASRGRASPGPATETASLRIA